MSSSFLREVTERDTLVSGLISLDVYTCFRFNLFMDTTKAALLPPLLCWLGKAERGLFHIFIGCQPQSGVVVTKWTDTINY